jgi:hypothetical protein
VGSLISHPNRSCEHSAFDADQRDNNARLKGMSSNRTGLTSYPMKHTESEVVMARMTKVFTFRYSVCAAQVRGVLSSRSGARALSGKGRGHHGLSGS